MTRCARSLVTPAMFYRVLCLTLTCLVFIFCLIITGLFVDIDALITSKSTVKSLKTPLQSDKESLGYYARFLPTFGTLSKEAKETSWSKEYEFPLRTRRSPDTLNPNLMKIHKEKVNVILKNRLISLLQEMESENVKTNENPTANIKYEDENKGDNDTKARYINKLKEIIANLDDLTSTSKNDGHIHLAIQNILLEGMVNHMNLNEVYKKVEEVANSFKASTQKKGPGFRNVYDLNQVPQSFQTKHMNIQTGGPYNINTQMRQINSNYEDKNNNDDILAKYIQYHQLKDELSDNTGHINYDIIGKYDKIKDDFVEKIGKIRDQDNVESKHFGSTYERYVDEAKDKKTENSGPKLLIKASIDVSPLENRQSKDNTIKDNNDIQGIIEMTYKGIPIKFKKNNERTTTGNIEGPGSLNKLGNGINEDIVKRILSALNTPQNINTQLNFDTSIRKPITRDVNKIVKKRELTEQHRNPVVNINNMGSKKWTDIGIQFYKERLRTKRQVIKSSPATKKSIDTRINNMGDKRWAKITKEMQESSEFGNVNKTMSDPHIHVKRHVVFDSTKRFNNGRKYFRRITKEDSGNNSKPSAKILLPVKNNINKSTIKENHKDLLLNNKLGGTAKNLDPDRNKTMLHHHPQTYKNSDVIYYNNTHFSTEQPMKEIDIKDETKLVVKSGNYGGIDNITASIPHSDVEKQDFFNNKRDLLINNMGNKKIVQMVPETVERSNTNKGNKTAELRVHVKRDATFFGKNSYLLDMLNQTDIEREKTIETIDIRSILKRSIETDKNQSYIPAKKEKQDTFNDKTGLRLNNMGNKIFVEKIPDTIERSNPGIDNTTAELRVHVKRDATLFGNNSSLLENLNQNEIAREKNIDTTDIRRISKRSVETEENQSYKPSKKVKNNKKIFHKPVTKKIKNKNKLYLKIETHFKDSGMSAVEKKNMIQNLMKKIEKVIQSHEFQPRTKKVVTEIKKQIFRVRKRDQLPIDPPTSTPSEIFNKTIYKNGTFGHKMYNPSIIYNIEKRQTDPIVKVLKFRNGPPESLTFKRISTQTSQKGPDFSMYDSREIGDIHEAFLKDSESKIIPQRIQRPIFLKESEDNEESKTVFRVGNDQMVINNLDGNGISIGYNQYVEDATQTDKEESELHNILKEYKEHFGNYDDIQPNYDEYENYETPESNYAEELRQKKYGYFSERKVFKRSIERRSSKEHKIVSETIDDGFFNKHENSNEYTVLIDQGHPLGWLEYQDILRGYKYTGSKYTNMPDIDGYIKENQQNNMDTSNYSEKSEASNIKRVAAILENNPFDKMLKPSEIFALSTLLDRRKRQSIKSAFEQESSNRIKRHATTHRLYKHIHSNKIGNRFSKFRQRLKTKLHKVLTKRSRNHIMNKRRNKRQAFNQFSVKFHNRNDRPIVKPKYSDEELFVVSDERNINEDVTRSTGEINLYAPNHRDEFLQRYVSLKLPNFNEKIPDEEALFQKISTSGHQNRQELMRNYPHILQENSDTQKIQSSEDNYSKYYNATVKRDQMKDIDDITEDMFADDDVSENIHLLEKQLHGKPIDNTKYKVTVKVFPKNASDISSGFKETHTSINKTINKNGLIYVSQFNLSQISHIQNPNENKTKERLKRLEDNYKARLIDHKNKLESQLYKIKSQKDRIDQLLVQQDSKNIQKSDLIEVVLPFDPPKLVKLSKELVSGLVTSALTKLQVNDENKTDTKNECETTTMPARLTTTSPPFTTENNSNKPDGFTGKPSLRSDTDIIAKIEKNTQTLEKFLDILKRGLSEDHTTPFNFLKSAADTRSNFDSVLLLKNVTPNNTKLLSPNFERTYYSGGNLNDIIDNNENNIQNYLKTTDTLFKDQNVSNNTPTSFIYAIHPPYYVSPLNAENPMTNIIYHGHIHANNDAPMKVKNSKFVPNYSTHDEGKDKNNNTKYFIDDAINGVVKTDNIRPSGPNNEKIGPVGKKTDPGIVKLK